jgi:hypothetical protein
MNVINSLAYKVGFVVDKSGTARCLNLSTLICSGECYSTTALYGKLLLYSEHYIAGGSKRFSIQEHVK